LEYIGFDIDTNYIQFAEDRIKDRWQRGKITV
jgi:hypothetical protein